jgi:hypothetical protein
MSGVAPSFGAALVFPSASGSSMDDDMKVPPPILDGRPAA